MWYNIPIMDIRATYNEVISDPSVFEGIAVTAIGPIVGFVAAAAERNAAGMAEWGAAAAAMIGIALDGERRFKHQQQEPPVQQ